MTARIEEIMQTWETQLNTLGVPVYRLLGKRIPKQSASESVYKLHMGALDVVEEQSNPNQYWELNIIIEVVVTSNNALESALNGHYENIYNLIMSSLTARQLGLTYVFDTECDGFNPPENELIDGEKPKASMEILFRTKFKQPLDSAST